MSERNLIRTAPAEDAEQIIDAIRSGSVDAFVVEEREGHTVYRLEDADLPYNTLVQRMQQGAAMVNPQGTIIYCNPSLAALIGMREEVVAGIPFIDLFAPEHRFVAERILADSESASGDVELNLRRADGTTIPTKIAVVRLTRDNSIIGILVTDLSTEKSYAELASRILRLQDEERRGIARELHDSVGQLLAAITMNLTRAQQLAAAQPESEGATLIADSAQMVSEVSKEIRTISHLLHPPLLDVAGLSSAIRWYVDGFSERSRIKVDVQVPRDLPRLDNDAEIAIFRIVQEALTNVYRHSGSSSCAVAMETDDQGLRVVIRDTGRGMIKVGNAESLRSGFGLRGMQERLRRLGGNLQIDSGESGTTIVAMLPLKTPAESRHADDLQQAGD